MIIDHYDLQIFKLLILFFNLQIRINSLNKPLLLVDCTVNKWKHSRMEYVIKARSSFKQRSNGC